MEKNPYFAVHTVSICAMYYSDKPMSDVIFSKRYDWRLNDFFWDVTSLQWTEFHYGIRRVKRLRQNYNTMYPPTCYNTGFDYICYSTSSITNE